MAFTLARHSGRHLALSVPGWERQWSWEWPFAACIIPAWLLPCSCLLRAAGTTPIRDFDSLALVAAAAGSCIILGFTLGTCHQRQAETAATSIQGRCLYVSCKAAHPVDGSHAGRHGVDGGNSFYIHYFLTHDIARDQQIAEMADEILYLDSVISQSAKNLRHGRHGI